MGIKVVFRRDSNRDDDPVPGPSSSFPVAMWAGWEIVYREGRRSCVPPVSEGELLLLWDWCVCTSTVTEYRFACKAVALQPFQQMLNLCLNIFLPRGPN